MPIPLKDEHIDAVDIFLVAQRQVRYSAMGKPLGVDLNTVIELVKLKGCADPEGTVKKVVKLSDEFVRSHG